MLIFDNFPIGILFMMSQIASSSIFQQNQSKHANLMWFQDRKHIVDRSFKVIFVLTNNFYICLEYLVS